MKINLWEASFLILFSNIFFWYIKLPNDLSAKCYRNNKERLQKQAREKYQSLSEEKKEQYGHEQRNNLPRSEKQKLVEYRKI